MVEKYRDLRAKLKKEGLGCTRQTSKNSSRVRLKIDANLQVDLKDISGGLVFPDTFQIDGVGWENSGSNKKQLVSKQIF